MSSAFTASGTTARPRITYFYWLNARRAQQRRVQQTGDNVVYLESSYIPTGTADLWRRTKPGLRAG